MPARLVQVNIIEPPQPGATRTKFTRYRAIVPGWEFCFKRKAEAVTFNDRMGDLLTSRTREMNRLTADLYAEYRRRAVTLDETERVRAATAFMHSDRQLSMLLKRSGHGSGAYYAVAQHIRVWASLLEEVCDILRAVNLSADTEARYTLRLTREGLDRVLRDVDEMPGSIYIELTGTPGKRRK